MAKLSLAEHAERVVYRIAGLPIAVAALRRSKRKGGGNDGAMLDVAFAERYWHPEGASEWLELATGLILWPVGLVGASLWYTARNGPRLKRRGSRGLVAQLRDQMRLYFSTGTLAPWYYIFSLDEDGSGERARSFLQRYETKTSLFLLLKQHKGSPLNDKARFAAFCAEHAIPCVPTVASLDGKTRPAALPEMDLFVKPSKGRGGRGAERWDRVGPNLYQGPDGKRLEGEALLDLLVRRSRRTPLVIQPRLRPHPELARLTAGALPTTRIVTCLNEHGEPEVVAGLLRMSIGANSTVDNMHAGGIAAAPDVDTGKLSRASDLGMSARIGWLSAHPDTGEQIEGRAVPHWEQAKKLAIEAHRHFSDRTVIGWDIGILEEGPVLIEGNGNPDMDIIQRFMRVGLRQRRLGELIAWHLKRRLEQSDNAFRKPKSALT